LYATSGSSDQNGIKTDASAFRRCAKAGYWNAVRKGFAGCDNPAIQSVASASNENWIEESAYRQKDSDNVTSSAARRRSGQLQNKPACATILPTLTAYRIPLPPGIGRTPKLRHDAGKACTYFDPTLAGPMLVKTLCTNENVLGIGQRSNMKTNMKRNPSAMLVLSF
jgi:hypothetical protein